MKKPLFVVRYTERKVDKKYGHVRNFFEISPMNSLKEAEEWVSFLKKDPDIIDIKIEDWRNKPAKVSASKGKKGWKSESARHALARKGIKTGRKKR